MTSTIKVDTISEYTSAGGVTIDGLTIKDGNIIGDVALAGTTPTFTIGDSGAEDASLIFDGNAQDFYIALDDSADDLVIGLGNSVGTTPMLSFTEAGAATFKNVGTGDDNPMVLTLQTAEADIAADDVIGKIAFQAPDEGTGTDAILVAAGIQAVSEGDFSSSSNATSLQFMTGASEAAAAKMYVKSNGNVSIGTANPIMSGYDSSSTKLTVYDGSGSAQSGYLELGANAASNGHNVGVIQWVNENNADDTNLDADGKVVNMIRSTVVTSDGNAGDDCGADMEFWTKAESGSLTKAMMLESDGDLNLQDGDLVMGNGKGINFGAMADTGTGESSTGSVLKDYEQGTFTCVPSTTGTDFTSSSVGGGCYYTKIGDWVHCNVNWFVTTPSGTAASGSFVISGMPFVCNAGGNSCNGTMASFGRTTLPTSYWPAYSNIADNASVVYFYYMGSQSGVNAFEADNLEGMVTPYGGFSIGYPCD